MSNRPDRVGKTLVSTWFRACEMQYSALKGYTADEDWASETRIRGTLLTTNDLSRCPMLDPSLRKTALARTSNAARISCVAVVWRSPWEASVRSRPKEDIDRVGSFTWYLLCR